MKPGPDFHTATADPSPYLGGPAEKKVRKGEDIFQKGGRNRPLLLLLYQYFEHIHLSRQSLITWDKLTSYLGFHILNNHFQFQNNVKGRI